MGAKGLRGVQVSLAPGWDILLEAKTEAGWGQPSWGPPMPLHTPAVCSSNSCTVRAPLKATVLDGTNFRSGRALAWLSSPLAGAPRCRNCCLVTKLCLTLSDPMEYSPPGSSVHGILQARILQWGAISFSRGSSRPRDWTHISCIGRQILHCWVTREAHDAEDRYNIPRTFQKVWTVIPVEEEIFYYY